jgi:hypothetical protein
MVDASTAPRLGRILRARTFVTGSVSALGANDVRIDALPSTVYGDPCEPGTAQASGLVERIFDLEKRIVFDVVENKMRITLSDEERRAIQNTPRPSLDAFLAFCNGLDFEASGRYSEAGAEFRRAAAIDPSFGAARDAAMRSEDLAASSTLADPETIFEPPPDREELGARLDNSAGQTSISHMPSESVETETRETGIGDPPASPRPR